jgi:hypothetical protein
MSHHGGSLIALGQSLAQLRADALGVAAFCSQARAQTELLAALPPRYAEVWLGLLDRLESSALFNEESCSFSQSALLDSLDVWLQKATGQLGA